MSGPAKPTSQSRGRASGLSILYLAFVLGLVAIASAFSLAGGEPVMAQSAGQPRTHVVEIRQFKFFPATLNVKPGDTIVWKNLDIAPHTATSDDWDSGNLRKDQTWSLKVTERGTIEYICAYHPAMKARIVSR